MSLHKKPLLKIILLGDICSGKTSLMNQYVNRTFSTVYRATVGVDFCCKDVTVNNISVILQLWDTAGQERFKSIGNAMYRGTDCCVLVFDVSDTKSFNSLDTWHELFLKNADPYDPKNFPFILLGNKVDLHNREISTVEAERWCQSNNATYFETSALHGTNVENAFTKITELALKAIDDQQGAHDVVYGNKITLGLKPSRSKNCSC